jgi:hypothetical protein
VRSGEQNPSSWFEVRRPQDRFKEVDGTRSSHEFVGFAGEGYGVLMGDRVRAAGVDCQVTALAIAMLLPRPGALPLGKRKDCGDMIRNTESVLEGAVQVVASHAVSAVYGCIANARRRAGRDRRKRL